MKKILIVILTAISITLIGGCQNTERATTNSVSAKSNSKDYSESLIALKVNSSDVYSSLSSINKGELMEKDIADVYEEEEAVITPAPTPEPTLTPMQKKYKNYDKGYEDLYDTCPEPDKIYSAKSTKQIDKLEQYLKDAGYYNEWYGEEGNSDAMIKITDTKRNGKKYGIVCVADYLNAAFVFYYYTNDPDTIYCDQISHGNEGIFTPELYSSKDDQYFLTVTYDEVEEYLASLNPEEDMTNTQAFTPDEIYVPAQEKAKELIASYLDLDQLDFLASYFSFEDINDAYFEYDEEDNSYYLNFEVYWMQGGVDCYFWVQSEFVYKNNVLNLRHMDVDEE